MPFDISAHSEHCRNLPFRVPFLSIPKQFALIFEKSAYLISIICRFKNTALTIRFPLGLFSVPINIFPNICMAKFEKKNLTPGGKLSPPPIFSENRAMKLRKRCNAAIGYNQIQFRSRRARQNLRQFSNISRRCDFFNTSTAKDFGNNRRAIPYLCPNQASWKI